MMTKVNFNLILMLMCIFFVACKKEVVGPKGETGQPGANGNANYLYNQKTILLSQSWIRESNKRDWNANMPNSFITKGILDTGSIAVAVEMDGEWRNLPFFKSDNFMQATFAPGNIHLQFYKIHGLAQQPVSMNVKVMIVSRKQ